MEKYYFIIDYSHHFVKSTTITILVTLRAIQHESSVKF